MKDPFLTQNVFHFGSNLPPKKFPDHFPKHYPHKDKLLRRSNIAPFFGGLSQNDNLSEIKPPLSSGAKVSKVEKI